MPLLAGVVGVGDGATLATSIFAARAGVADEADGAALEASALAARAGDDGLASAEVEGATAGEV